MSQAGEFTRIVKLDRLAPGAMTLEATADECAALARRFGLPAVHKLTATVTLEAQGAEVSVAGSLAARIEQNCAISGEAFPNRIEEPLAFRFVPRAQAPQAGKFDEEIELDSDELDEIEYDDLAFDLGEAVAQSLALAIDPYATGPNAEKTRREAGLAGDDAAGGPFAALAQWKGAPSGRDR